MMHRFSTPTPPELTVEFRSGSIVVRTQDVDETTVELRGARDDDLTSRVIAETIIEQRGDGIVVLVPKRGAGSLGRTPDLLLTVTAPNLTALAIRSGSADVTAQGRVGVSSILTGSGDVTAGEVRGALRIRSGSGEVRVERIDGDADIGTGSGDVELGAMSGAVSAHTGSGDVRVGSGGSSLDVKTGSGDVDVIAAPDQLSAKTGSGHVRIESARRGEIRARTASGDIRAGIQSGTAAWLDVRTVTGRVSSDLERAGEPAGDEDRVRLHLETVTGDIELVRVSAD